MELPVLLVEDDCPVGIHDRIGHDPVLPAGSAPKRSRSPPIPNMICRSIAGLSRDEPYAAGRGTYLSKGPSFRLMALFPFTQTVSCHADSVRSAGQALRLRK